MREQKDLRSETTTPRDVPTSETGLLPCPFCGDVAIHKREQWKIQCAGCGVTMPVGKAHVTELVQFWNKRVASQSSPTQTPADNRENQNSTSPPTASPRVSKCCNAPLTVSTADEGTSCYICTKCGNASDPAVREQDDQEIAKRAWGKICKNPFQNGMRVILSALREQRSNYATKD